MGSSRFAIGFKDSSGNISARLSGVARDGSVGCRAEVIKFLSKRKLNKEVSKVLLQSRYQCIFPLHSIQQTENEGPQLSTRSCGRPRRR